MSSNTCLRARPSPVECLRDCICIVFVCALGTVLPIGNLGFYGADWAMLAELSLSADTSLLGFIQAADTPADPMRPITVLPMGIAYWLFADQALGYHASNALLRCGAIVLLYFLLLKWRALRPHVLGACFMAALLPLDSSNRFWVYALQINLSLIVLLLAVFAYVCAIQTKRLGALVWLAISVLAGAVSLLCYGQTFALLLAIAPLVWMTRRQLESPQSSAEDYTGTQDRQSLKHMLCGVCVIGSAIVVALLKFGYSARLQTLDLVAQGEWFLHTFAASAFIGFVDYGIALPLSAWHLFADWWAIPVAICISAIAYIAVSNSATKCSISSFSSRTWLYTGVMITVLGYAVFLTNRQMTVSLSGAGNRAAHLAVVGFAFVWVGAFLWSVKKLPLRRARRPVFALLVAVFCGLSSVVNAGIARHWQHAASAQTRVLSEIKRALPKPQRAQIILLGGICPYRGHAPMLTGDRDVTGALRVLYGDETLAGDVLSRTSVRLGERGLAIASESGSRLYLYSPRLIAYDTRKKDMVELANNEVATAFMQREPPDCAVEREGRLASLANALFAQ